MKKILFTFLCFFTFSLIVNAIELNLNSQSAIVIEASSGKVLYEKNSNEKMAPASMTKIMTLLLTMEAIESGKLKLTDEVMISERASSMGGSQVYLEANTKMKVETLLKAVAIASANDAAVALAEAVGGTYENFVNLMNEKVRELGLKNTEFKNPHGLDEANHYTTAYDLSIIASELVKYESVLKLSSTYEDYLEHPNGEKIWLVNTNSLIRFYNGLDGLKTGYTSEAGYCLTGTMEKNGMRLITVTMKAESSEKRNNDTVSLMEYAFSTYSINNILKKDKSLGNIYVDKGVKRSVNYYLEKDVNVIVTEETRNIDYKYDIKIDTLEAPLNKNDKVGELILTYNGEKTTYNLVVRENVKKASFFRQMKNIFKDLVVGTMYLKNS